MKRVWKESGIQKKDGLQRQRNWFERNGVVLKEEMIWK